MDNAKNNNELLWNAFAHTHNLTPDQLAQFKTYADMLMSWNNDFNLTAITNLPDVVLYHFQDSLAVCDVAAFQKSRSFADVGTGGGFPGIPLKIMNPDKKLCLIEVNQKKIIFLREVVAALNLADVMFIDQDWRTFLRSTAYDIDFFCARASLQPEELVRLFKPSSAYKHAQLVYWAAQAWQPSGMVKKYIRNDVSYEVGDKQRRLIVMNQV